MKKSTIAFIAVAAVLVLWAISVYNGLVNQDETVNNAWAKVESDYQRRADLIPSLVSTVKGYAKHEKDTYEAVVNARSKATQTTISVDDLTEENMQRFQQAQGELSSALSRLIAVQENYPELKANENFMDLQKQLEGTENRIKESRNNFNDAAKAYNIAVRKFPGNIVAMIFGFQQKPMFKSAEGADKAPEISFD